MLLDDAGEHRAKNIHRTWNWELASSELGIRNTKYGNTEYGWSTSPLGKANTITESDGDKRNRNSN